jgi:hypothetical protein
VWYHPVAYVVGRRDVIGAWLVCFAIGAMFFGLAVIESMVYSI